MTKAISLLLSCCLALAAGTPVAAACTRLQTRHEGRVEYCDAHGFLVRAHVPAQDVPKPERDRNYFWKDFDRWTPAVRYLVKDIGIRPAKPRSEAELWQRVGVVWNWLKAHAVADNDAYSSLKGDADRWPSLPEFARYYKRHGRVPWAACFSKAHLFAVLVGKTIPPAERKWRSRILVASGHHTEGGAPPTASHVFLALRVAGRWYYLDPTAVHSRAFPPFAQRASIGTPGMDSVDYAHPFSVRVLPGGVYPGVPYLGGSSPAADRKKRPDLVISGMKLLPAEPVEGRPVKVAVRVANRGAGTAGPFAVQWWPGERYAEPAGEWRIDGLKPDTSKTLRFVYAGYPSRYDRIRVKVVADPENRVRERDEGNNMLLQAIRVLPR